MHVYVLFSRTLNRYYVGQTADLEKRYDEHQSKKFASGYTTLTNDWEVYIAIECKSRAQAVRIENHIKAMKSRTYIENLSKYKSLIERLQKRFQ